MRRYLLDTHVLLWCMSDSARLGELAREQIVDPLNEIYVSAVSSWEISIKRQLGKLVAPDDIESAVHKLGFDLLSVSFFHGEQVGRLPMIHRDPFDRMLVAQAQTEGLELITGDRQVRAYGVRTVDAAR